MTAGDADLAAEKKQNISFSQVECVQCSFKKLARITNLSGLDNLVKLQLDNNQITKIENLSHLVRAHDDCAAADTDRTRVTYSQ